MHIVKRIASAGLPYYMGTAALHVLGIALLVVASRQTPMLLGLGLLAYTLGLRHAFDADHIAAIDNTVRKLIQLKRDPNGVGFFFSLGHSTIVFLMALLLGLSSKWAQAHMPFFQEVGGYIGATVSGVFLILTAVFNAVVLVDMVRVFRSMKGHAGAYDDGSFDAMLDSRGFIYRIFGRIFAFVDKSWHVYPIGLLFGLGFDTATEVALLAMSAGATQSNIPLYGTLCLPILFAAGMNLMDTTDSVMMSGAYQWAFDTPVRKVYYNLTITSASVLAAVMIGLVELLQVAATAMNLQNGFWNWVQGIDFNYLGYAMVVLFLGFWLVSMMIWKYGKVEQRWS
ncbi:HoxN/HupN/NixA family nickel/cobalt transporter [uncultured Bifidobacterium sp.]|uniref:HoxN/HupN/NixA family nickel/cobalt transporter n=1 Tax=uncultured Bifidobacterium sp. TaxID=165187 RepID=UPI000EF05EBB|nr:HoxN/HupN/NixA family nickel/cobalt transporter [uncultured Bifidobacterium sp.]HAH53443.1 HoxN/HupN/NixA family nickel/cobalt transporter [Bifidobacterium sp.]HCH21297.1 HoxN/HupN/NixA family nickel/cobalt transporter [Bifidobacterium sp.]